MGRFLAVILGTTDPATDSVTAARQILAFFSFVFLLGGVLGALTADRIHDEGSHPPREGRCTPR
jgi:hypothetical protein